MDCSALNLYCYICDHKFTDQEIINDQFNVCCNPNCKNLLCDYFGISSIMMILKEMKISSKWNHIKKSEEHKKNMEKSNK